MVVPEPGDRGDAVEERHVQIDDDGVGIEVVREVDCLEAVVGLTDDLELRLAVDQLAERPDEQLVVVRDQHLDPIISHRTY